MRTWRRLWGISIAGGLLFGWPWFFLAGKPALYTALAWAPFAVLFTALFAHAHLTSTRTGRTRPAAPSGLSPEPRRRVPLPPALKASVWVRDKARCQSCRITDSDAMEIYGEHLQFDHVIPWSLGGPDTEENIRLLCGPCNRAKGASLI